MTYLSVASQLGREVGDRQDLNHPTASPGPHCLPGVSTAMKEGKEGRISLSPWSKERKKVMERLK